MGLWQANFADLASVGIEVTAGQREALDEGGDVLLINTLIEPGSAYCQCGTGHPAFDVSGNIVQVAMLMKTWPAHDIAPSVFHRPGGTTYLSEVVDAEHDEHWRFWPSYVGHPIAGVDCMEYEYTYFEDRPHVRRIWSGFPLSEIGDVAHEILGACNARVEATPWWSVDRMIGYLECDEPPTEEEIADDPSGEHLEYKEAADELEACQMWSKEDRDFAPGFTLNLDYPPMERYLTPPALYVWNDLLRSSRSSAVKASHTIRRGERNVYANRESGYDPWF